MPTPRQHDEQRAAARPRQAAILEEIGRILEPGRHNLSRPHRETG
jgi:hypothetical protein